jgi:hypothetical protein
MVVAKPDEVEEPSYHVSTSLKGGRESPLHRDFRRTVSTAMYDEFNPLNHKMMIMDFHEFSLAGKIPNYYEAVCKPFEEVINKDGLSREDWLVIFVSHRWCQGEQGFEVDSVAKDRRGAPDTDECVKYDLIVEAVEKIITMIGGNPKVALWLDYSCIEQRGNTEMEVGRRDAGFMVRPTDDAALGVTWWHPYLTSCVSRRAPAAALVRHDNR